MQFCGQPGCGVLVERGRCAAHAPRDRHASAEYARVHRWYVSSRWLRLRMDVLRADPFCRQCRTQGQRVLATDVDHIFKHDGNAARFWDVRNLQSLCRACHTRKTTRGE